MFLPNTIFKNVLGSETCSAISIYRINFQGQDGLYAPPYTSPFILSSAIV